MSFTLALPGALRNRWPDSTHLGQRHKRVFGRWHALCFLATHRFSPHTSSGTNTSHRHSLSCLGTTYESSLLHMHHFRKTLFFGIIIFVRLIYSSVESNRHFQFCICPCHGCHKSPKRSPSTPLLTSFGSHHHPSLSLGFISSIHRLSVHLYSQPLQDFPIEGTIVSVCQHSSGRVITNTVPQPWHSFVGE